MSTRRPSWRGWNFRDATPFVLSWVSRQLTLRVHTVAARLQAAWWNVGVSPRCTFYGLPIFRKHPTGAISIGSGCTFRSAEWSNSIGINRRCFISAGRAASVRIGSDCGLSGTVIAAARQIRIGDRVLCGANCTICDTDRHPLSAAARARETDPEAAPIEIGDDVFLGMNVVVLKGVKIGSGTVVAANSIVTRSLPPGVLAAGIPAKLIRLLEGSNLSNPLSAGDTHVLRPGASS